MPTSCSWNISLSATKLREDMRQRGGVGQVQIERKGNAIMSHGGISGGTEQLTYVIWLRYAAKNLLAREKGAATDTPVNGLISVT